MIWKQKHQHRSQDEFSFGLTTGKRHNFIICFYTSRRNAWWGRFPPPLTPTAFASGISKTVLLILYLTVPIATGEKEKKEKGGKKKAGFPFVWLRLRKVLQ